MDRKTFHRRLRALRIELLKMQRWVATEGARLLLLFEGRDAAGKGGAISTIVKHLNPRDYRVVALPKPTQREQNEWYFQRYVQHLPTAGEIVLFDRSWYNRAGVERVMGFCSEAQAEHFLSVAPEFEAMLVNDGMTLLKFWFSITAEEQIRRLEARRNNPLKQWKLTPLDLQAQDRWDAYSKAKSDVFTRTATGTAPWHEVAADDKRAARLAVIQTVLRHVPYSDRDESILGIEENRIRAVEGG